MKKTSNSWMLRTAQVEQLRKEAEKAQRILDQIEMMKNSLQRMADENNWLNYADGECTEQLTDEEKSLVCIYQDFIKYAVYDDMNKERLSAKIETLND